MSARKGWIYHADGTVTEKGAGGSQAEGSAGPAIFGDEGSFVSPIDGKTYSGKAGMREHNRIHNVVNNRDLVGLPYETMNREYKPDRKATRAAIVEALKSKGYL
jgi:hypothetical protein